MMATTLVFSILGWAAMVQPSPIRAIAEFPGSSLKWICVAAPEIERQRLNLDKYTVVVTEERDSVTVMMEAPSTVKGARGNASAFPEYAVEVSKKDLKVVRAYYIR